MGDREKAVCVSERVFFFVKAYTSLSAVSVDDSKIS